jgi:hypothetical protein
MLSIPELAAAAVANLAYLSDATAQKRGDRLAGRYDRLKTRLTSQIGRELLSNFERQPAAPDARATLRQALKVRLDEDPTFRVELDDLVEEISPWP